MKMTIIGLLSLTLILFHIANSLKCGENEIEGCSICGTGTNSTKCSLCEDKYFLVLDGEKCIRCDDDLLAMAGCDGNCQMIKSEKNVLCQENSCKEGYYEINPGTCAICSFLFSGCSKCTYTNKNEGDEKVFECLECQDERNYISYLDNRCNYCLDYNCKKCLNETFCIECSDGYTLYPNGKCQDYIYSCNKTFYSQEKKRGICLECKDGYTLYPNDTCIYNSFCKVSTFSEEKNMTICTECREGYALYPNATCNDYDYGCKNKTYSEEDKKGICFECKEGYFMDKYTEMCQDCNSNQKKYNQNFYGCKKCHRQESVLICDQAEESYYISSSGQSIYKCSTEISMCEKCSYHTEEDLANNILKCDKCQNGYSLSANEKSCYSCANKENGCIICSGNEEQTVCEKCSSEYFLNSNGTCTKCSNVLGEGCIKCSVSPFELSLYCAQCSEGYSLGNDGKCKLCENYLTGCQTCKPLGAKGFECLTCKEEYILIDGRCEAREDNDEFSLCKEMENIGKGNEIIYSCIQCKTATHIFAIKSNNAKICVEPSKSLGLYQCSSSKKESIGDNNYTCLECTSNTLLQYDADEKKEICNSCIEGYYKQEYYNSFQCYSCNNGCMKCHKDGNDNLICDECVSGYIKTGPSSCSKCKDHCEECSLNDNSEVICSKYKEPFFLNNNSQVDACFNHIDYCSKCSYLNDELKCEKCLEEYFLNKDGICQHCYINNNIGPHCISCTDNEELKANSPCQKCNGENYFLTKENTCIFCKSENYGGLFCDKCGYININDEEIIGCIECSSSYYAIDGKCIKKNYAIFCKEYGAIKKDNETIYACIKCEENYKLNEENDCIKILENCSPGYQLIDNSCVQIFPSSNEEIIEGCSLYEYKYNSYFCISCSNSYLINNGYCIKKISNPFLTGCSSLEYSNGFLECKSCSYSSSNIYLNSTLACYNEYYGRCYIYENIGTNLNPIYSCKDCDYTIVSDEYGTKRCYSNILNNRCKEGIINTNYDIDIYTCTKCHPLYILSYSDYYEKNTCKYIYEDEKTNNITNYESDTGTPTSNGECNDGYFTRNGKVCIKCDDPTNGMPGCGGKCTFKLNREHQLQCEADKCKDNYYETLPGKCELCNKTLSGCQSCSYIENDKKPIFKPERKRILVCNNCKDELILTNGVCKSYSSINMGCKTYHKEENHSFKCDEVYNGYYLDEEGNAKNCQNYCDKCTMIKEGEVDKLKCSEASSGYYLEEDGNIKKCEENCFKCSMINEDGINKVKCNEADYGYYLDDEGKINKCDNNCLECSMVKEDGINKIKCNSPKSGYFINSEGNLKECSDENEGISNCNSCSFYSSFYCYSCSSNYALIDRKCQSIEEITNVQGCSEYSSNEDHTYYCTGCLNEYLYINEAKTCVKKQRKLIIVKMPI